MLGAMIQRIQLYKLGAEGGGPTPEEAARALALEVGRVAGPHRVSIGLPRDPASVRSWDVSLVLEFDDADQGDAFLAGGALDDAVRRALGSAIVVEKGWTFTALRR